jgi:hypothetical protein
VNDAGLDDKTLLEEGTEFDDCTTVDDLMTLVAEEEIPRATLVEGNRVDEILVVLLVFGAMPAHTYSNFPTSQPPPWE